MIVGEKQIQYFTTFQIDFRINSKKESDPVTFRMILEFVYRFVKGVLLDIFTSQLSYFLLEEDFCSKFQESLNEKELHENQIHPVRHPIEKLFHDIFRRYLLHKKACQDHY